MKQTLVLPFSIISLVSSIVGMMLLLSVFGMLFSIPFIVAALIFAILALRKQKVKNGIAIAGLVVSLVGALILIAILIPLVIYLLNGGTL